MKDLSKIPIEKLLEEVERRHKDVEDYHKTVNLLSINSLIKKSGLIFGVQYTRGGEYGPQFTLGIVKKGKFLDFYYNSKVKNFQNFIPEGFHGCMESTYEYHSSKKLSNEKKIEEAISTLKKAGYTHFEETYE